MNKLSENDLKPRITPIERAWKRIEVDLQDSEITAFYSLLNLGEMITKIISATLAAGIQSDPENRRYATEYKLIRAAGVGEHVAAIDEALLGPTSELLYSDLRPLHKNLTQKVSADSPCGFCLAAMKSTLDMLGITPGEQAPPNTLRAWLHWFAQLRNKTRGHGAQRTEMISSAYPKLRESLALLTQEVEIFSTHWAYVKRNLSGKFRVTLLTPTMGQDDPFRALRTGSQTVNHDGIYLGTSSRLLHIKLLISDADLSDFFVPNGCFKNTKSEFISLITGETHEFDATEFTKPTNSLPGSETEGRSALEATGNCFSNMPPAPENYISRPAIENQLITSLTAGRHEIVTLSGPGGTGKTSVALHVCHSLCNENPPRFECVYWLSSRDIDLLSSGPKVVRPDGTSIKDFSKQLAELLNPAQKQEKGFRPGEYFAKLLSSSDIGPSLFVFDNFETATDPSEIFTWLDSHIRPPNKILITTRTRDFSGDKPIPVKGMEDDEARTLVETTAERLGVRGLLGTKEIDELISEAGGHPYVLKVLIGEISERGRYAKPDRIIADYDRLLAALFERTYSRLSPAAQLIFLILSSWKSAVPMVAVEVVLLHQLQERLQIKDAIEELVRFSMIDELQANSGNTFLSVPLASSTFGRKKLKTSSQRALVEQCVDTLKLFGATQATGTRRSVEESSQRFIRSIEKQIATEKLTLTEAQPLIEGLAEFSPGVWRLNEELVAQTSPQDVALRIRYLKCFIESGPSGESLVSAWKKLAQLQSNLNDHDGEVLAYGEIAQAAESSVRDVSDAANRLNNLLRARPHEEGKLSGDIKRASIEKVVRRMRDDFHLLSATDLSRLAWLYLNIGNSGQARAIAEEGRARQTDNEYCLRLIERLDSQED